MPSHSVRRYEVERQLAAIFFADVVNYSGLMGADEEGTLATLTACRRELIEPRIASHRGRIVKYTGDGMLVSFGSPVEAVRCAVEVQRSLAKRNVSLPLERRLQFRIGINLGDVIVQDADLHGDAVNIAARLETFAQPGEICVSRAVRDQVRDKVRFSLEDMGTQQLKNIARPLRVYRIRDPAEPVSAELPFPTARAALAIPNKPSIAVLPFTNMSVDPEQDYFADGMVEEIITALARIRWLFVIARNSTFTYKNRHINVKQVAGDLGVRYLLEGSVRKAGNNVRISAQLIDTTNEAHIWSERFDGVLDDVFELQDRIASSVAGCIEPQLQLAEIDRAKRKQPQNLTAYDLYLRARGEFHEHNDRGSRQAIDLARQALAIDPVYAPAAALIGECWVTRVSLGWGHASPADREEIVRLAKQAIRSGRDDPDALWMAAISLSSFSDEHALADMAVKRALVLNPNSAQAWNASGYICFKQNKNNEAIDAQKRAIRLSPLDPLGGYFSSVLAQSYLGTNQYEEALEWAERCLCELPTSLSAMRTITIANVQLGRMEDAHRARARWLELRPNETIAVCKAGVLKHLPPEILAVQINSLRQAGLPEA